MLGALAVLRMGEPVVELGLAPRQAALRAEARLAAG